MNQKTTPTQHPRHYLANDWHDCQPRMFCNIKQCQMKIIRCKWTVHFRNKSAFTPEIGAPFTPELSTPISEFITTPARPDVLFTEPDLKVKQSPDAAQGSGVVQSAETLPDLPGVNVAEGMRLMGHSVAGYCAILEEFHLDRQNTLTEIRSAIAENDWETAERLAHTLKGLLGTIGAEKLQDKTTELELALRGWDGKHIESLRSIERIESLLPVVDAELTQLFAAIDRAIKLREPL